MRVRTYGFPGCFTRPPGTSARSHTGEPTTSKPVVPWCVLHLQCSSAACGYRARDVRHRRRMGPRAARRRRGRGRRRPPPRGGRRAHRRSSPSATPARVAELDGPGLAEAIAELQAISDLAGRAGNYAALRFSVDTAGPRQRRADAARAGARRAPSRRSSCSSSSSGPRSTTTRPSELLASRRARDVPATTCAPPAATARTCSASPRRRSSPRRASPAASAWSRLFYEQVSALEVDAAGRGGAGRAGRRAVAAALARRARCAASPPRRVTASLQPGLRTRAYIFNTLLADKATDDRLRHYPNWLAARNLANEASDESVAGARRGRARPLRAPAPLVPAEGAAARASTASRTTTAWPRSAPTRRPSSGTRRASSSWTPTTTSPPSSATPRARSSTSNCIDAPVRPGKRGGAFCAYAVPSEHPYVLLNYTSRRRDVLTLAHELGHGVHASLARPRGILEQHTPLTLAETASVFGEDARVPPAAGPGRDAGVAARAAGRVDRGLDRDRLPPDRDEPLRGPRPHRPARGGRAVGRAHRRRCGSSRSPSCSATRSRSPRATGRGGPTSPTSSARPATSTRTPTASCSRCRSTSATSRRARRSCRATSSC